MLSMTPAEYKWLITSNHSTTLLYMCISWRFQSIDLTLLAIIRDVVSRRLEPSFYQEAYSVYLQGIDDRRY
jgi:hypothetical protein